MARPLNERNDALKAGGHLPVERYRWAATHIRGKTVVDVGCGMGYGTELLRAGHRWVVGVDISREAIEYSKTNYPAPYIIANAELQTFAGFDTIVCLEVLSHMVDPYTWVKNLAVGELVISMPTTPSMSVYPWRKHEIHESTLRQMIEPTWKIEDELLQTGSETYLTLYARDSQTTG